MKNFKIENVQRAVEILAAAPEGECITCNLYFINVEGKELDINDLDDLEVITILAANKEIGFAASYFEQVARVIRDAQAVHGEEWQKKAAA